MLGAFGVLAGAVLIRLTGWQWVDPVVAIGIGLWVLPRTWMLLKDTTRIFLEGVPRHLSLSEVRAAIGAAPGVSGVHDLHVWSLTSDDASLSVPVELAPAATAETVRILVAARLREKFGTDPPPIQADPERCEDSPA